MVCTIHIICDSIFLWINFLKCLQWNRYIGMLRLLSLHTRILQKSHQLRSLTLMIWCGLILAFNYRSLPTYIDGDIDTVRAQTLDAKTFVAERNAQVSLEVQRDPEVRQWQTHRMVNSNGSNFNHKIGKHNQLIMFHYNEFRIATPIFKHSEFVCWDDEVSKFTLHIAHRTTQQDYRNKGKFSEWASLWKILLFIFIAYVLLFSY